MPIYEFRCRKCEHEFEELFRSSAEGRSVVCPECGSRRCDKQWSAFGFAVAGGAARSSCDGGGCEHCRGGSCETCRH
jgi:putative FmdB family regulatory protein